MKPWSARKDRHKTRSAENLRRLTWQALEIQTSACLQLFFIQMSTRHLLHKNVGLVGCEVNHIILANSPQISSVLPPVNTTMGSSHSPTLQWRQAIRMDDGRSISTRSMLDEEEDENLIVDVENTDQQDSAYIPNFEV